MSEIIHRIKGVDFSESTIKNALEKSCGVVFGEKKYDRNTVFKDNYGRLVTLIWCHGCSAWHLLIKEGETYSGTGIVRTNRTDLVTVKELLSTNYGIVSLTEVK